MKAFRGVDGKIRLFRPELNMARMNSSAQRSGLPTFEPEEFIKCISRLVSIDQEWVPHTESASLYIRPTLYCIRFSLRLEVTLLANKVAAFHCLLIHATLVHGLEGLAIEKWARITHQQFMFKKKLPSKGSNKFYGSMVKSINSQKLEQ